MPPSTMPRSTMRSDPAAVSGPRGPSRPGPHPTAARPRHPPTTPTRTGGTCRRARRRSLRVLDAPDLAHDRDADLARILQLLLDALGDVPGEDLGPDVVDVLGLDHDPDLAAGLHREDLADPRVAGGDLLQLL